MMSRSKSRSVLVLAALLPALHACYEYTPLATATPSVGQLVELDVTDQGRVSLAERFGPGLTAVEARVVSQQENELVVNVYRVTHIGGESAQWSGETARLNRSVIGSIRGRQFSKSRTAVVAGIGTALAAYLIVNRGLLGSFSGPTEDPPSTDPPNQRLRIPISFPLFR
jgi:hypothetical protein